MANGSAGGRPVVIAFDGSPAARQAILDSAQFLGSCRILVVTVWEQGLAYASPVMAPDGLTIRATVDPETALELDSASHEHAERVSRDGADLARSLGLDAKPLALADEGNVTRTILNLAREQEAAAIVVGSRGLGGIRARLEGSTSKGLLKHASCPVIVVHEADEAHDEGQDEEAE